MYAVGVLLSCKAGWSSAPFVYFHHSVPDFHFVVGPLPPRPVAWAPNFGKGCQPVVMGHYLLHRKPGDSTLEGRATKATGQQQTMPGSSTAARSSQAAAVPCSAVAALSSMLHERTAARRGSACSKACAGNARGTEQQSGRRLWHARRAQSRRVTSRTCAASPPCSWRPATAAPAAPAPFAWHSGTASRSGAVAWPSWRGRGL